MKTSLRMIDKEIASFTTNRDKLRQQAHMIGMLILNHAAPVVAGPDAQGSGDCTRARHLVEAMPKSWAEQMTVWFRTFSPIRVVIKNDKCEFDPKYKKLAPADKPAHWRLEDAAQTPFWELTDEPDVQKAMTFEELVKMVDQLPKRIEKLIADGRVPDGDIASAEAVIDRLKTLRFKRVKAVADNDQSGEQAAA